jgi:hypothetical protein
MKTSKSKGGSGLRKNENFVINLKREGTQYQLIDAASDRGKAFNG